jgi:phosphoadenosine phosphosulfate reductase
MVWRKASATRRDRFGCENRDSLSAIAGRYLNLAGCLAYAVFSRLTTDCVRLSEPNIVADFVDDRPRDDALVMPAAVADSETSRNLSNSSFAGLDVVDRLRLLSRCVTGPVVFTTSFGIEDQALTHLIAESGIACGFATLDTGRLFPETHAVWAETEQRYGIRVEAWHPDGGALQDLVRQNGINGFYASIGARHACCGVRKVEPLGRALAGAAAWLTGLRADQSDGRGELEFVTHDQARGLLKVNPLLDWSRDRVAEFVRDAGVPHNALHDRGFLSIGCAPCTRAVAPGEPERAGRWWWEQDQARECGLHVGPDGRLVRAGKPS